MRDKTELVEVPESVYKQHINGFVINTYINHVNAVIPDSAQLVIDPDTQPQTGDIVLYDTNGVIEAWELFAGNTHILLLSNDNETERVDKKEAIAANLRGVVVWYQGTPQVRNMLRKYRQ